MGAPIGNNNAAKAKKWTAAIERALERRAKVSLRTMQEELDDLAEKFLQAVEQGDIAAWKELGDRMEGKPAQALAVTGEDGGPVNVFFAWDKKNE